jgi:hypothetical protein
VLPVCHACVYELEVLLPEVADDLCLLVTLQVLSCVGSGTFPQEKQRTGMIILGFVVRRLCFVDTRDLVLFRVGSTEQKLRCEVLVSFQGSVSKKMFE